MIKVKTMYGLYVKLIQESIREKTLFVEEQRVKLEKQMMELDKVKHIISQYVDIYEVLDGNIKEIPEKYLITKEVKYANIVLRNYYELKFPIETKEREIASLKRQKIDYKLYKDIITSFNKIVIDYILKTGTAFTDEYLGSLQFLVRENTNNVINWGESNKNKRKLLEAGLHPYCKAEEEKAIEQGVSYPGIKWMVFGREHPIVTLKWNISDYVREVSNKETHKQKYNPSRGRYGIGDLLIKFNKQKDTDYSIYTKA